MMGKHEETEVLRAAEKLVEAAKAMVKEYEAWQQEQKPEPEQRYCVVDLGAEVAEVDARYIEYDAHFDDTHFRCKRVTANDVRPMSKEVAEQVAFQARDVHGWYCEVRPWPEKLWCVTGLKHPEMSSRETFYIKPYGSISGICHSRFVPDKGMSRTEAERVAGRARLTWKSWTNIKILPFPPPEQPVAVKFRLRCTCGCDYLYLENFHTYSAAVIHQDTIDHGCTKTEIVGFDKHGNEVEVK